MTPAHASGVELARDSVGIAEHCTLVGLKTEGMQVTSGVVVDWVVLDFWIGILTGVERR